MSRTFQQLNLRPHERRLVVGVGLLFFALLNIWLVFPRFAQWGKYQRQLSGNHATLARWKRAFSLTNKYRIQLKKLEGEGSTVLPADQANQLDDRVQSAATKWHLTILEKRPVMQYNQSTNFFFQEKAINIRVNTGNRELIQFLLSLGASGSMVRVRSLDLRPDPTQTRLIGLLTLVASYQRATAANSKSMKLSVRTP